MCSLYSFLPVGPNKFHNGCSPGQKATTCSAVPWIWLPSDSSSSTLLEQILYGMHVSRLCDNVLRASNMWCIVILQWGCTIDDSPMGCVCRGNTKAYRARRVHWLRHSARHCSGWGFDSGHTVNSLCIAPMRPHFAPTAIACVTTYMLVGIVLLWQVGCAPLHSFSTFNLVLVFRLMVSKALYQKYPLNVLLNELMLMMHVA